MSENETTPKKSQAQVNKAVFFSSALLIFPSCCFLLPHSRMLPTKILNYFSNKSSRMQSWFSSTVLAVALILLSVTFLGLSRYGDIKLGLDHAQPDFSYHSGFAMLFCRDGIGLMFFGVAEPVTHYSTTCWHPRRPLRQRRERCG